MPTHILLFYTVMQDMILNWASVVTAGNCANYVLVVHYGYSVSWSLWIILNFRFKPSIQKAVINDKKECISEITCWYPLLLSLQI